MTSSRAPTSQPSAHATEDAALELLQEVRASLGLPAVSLVHDEQLARELRDAHALLTMLASMLRASSDPATQQDVRYNWDKALRRRGWLKLPSFDPHARDSMPAPRTSAPPKPTASAAASSDRGSQPEVQRASAPVVVGEPAVHAFLRCFGVSFDPSRCSPETLQRASAVCCELQRDVDALRVLPLLLPVSYARRFGAIATSWNDLAALHPELPKIDLG